MGSRGFASAPPASDRSAFVAGSLTVLVAGLGLLGWLTGAGGLASLNPASTPMVPATALAFLGFGGVLMLESRRPARAWTGAVSALLAVFAAIQLVISVVGQPARIDALFVPLPALFAGVPSGRTPALTALGLLLAGLSGLSLSLAALLGRRVLHAAAASLALGVHLLGMVVTLGYLFGAPLLYGSPVRPVPFATGLAFACVGLALVSLAPPDSGPLSLFSGDSPRARLRRAFLPVAPAIVIGELLFAQVGGLNPALHAALTAMLSALVAAGAVAWVAHGVSRRLDDAHRDAERLAAIIESSEDAIVAKTLNGVITSWNAGAERTFGYAAHEALGQPMLMLLPAERAGEEAELLARIAQGECVPPFESVRIRRDRTAIEVSVSIAPLRDGRGRIDGASTIARDITALKARERERQRLSRLYAALSEINQAIARARTRDELLPGVCRALVGAGFRMAWVAWQTPDGQRLTPLAECGDEDGYLQRAEVHTGDERPEGRGPSGTAFREGRPYVCNDARSDPALAPWRAELERRRLRSAAVFPVRQAGVVRGTLNVYADEVDVFKEEEIALLRAAADDVSFALDSLEHDDERQRAQAAAVSERRFSDTMIDSMPGILYFYDSTGRFLRWNRNFETVSGYSAAEIARMHPRDFFPDEEQPRVEERIAEVFVTGESSVEALFLSRDGSVTPYFFTGRRVQLEGEVCLVGVGIDVSERRRAEAALREAELRFHTLFEETPVGIVVVDPASTSIVEVNQQAARQLGYTPAELAGLGLAAFEAPDTPGETQRRLAELAAQGRVEFQTRHRTRSGELRDTSVSGRMVTLDGREVAHCVFLDVTARTQAEAALRQSERRFRSTLDDMLEGCQLIGFDWRYLYLNHMAEVHNRRPNAEMLGRTLQEMFPGIEVTRAYTLLRTCMEERVAQEEEIEFTFQEGDTAWFGLRIQPVPEGIFVLSVEVSERKRVEQALRELNVALERKVAERTEELRAALVRAEAADRIKSAFLATMSHELRTPLNSIIGFTGVLLQGLAGPLNPEQAKQLGMVRVSGRHLLELINDVLDLSKIEAGQLELRAEPFDLRASLERVTTSVKPQADKKGLELCVVAPPELGVMVSDRRRVEQVLINLLNNALKFTERGRVTLSAEALDHDAGGAEAAPRGVVRLRVADTGMGIRPADMPVLFQPFRQLDSGLARQHEGSGLGLAICRRLTLLLGGEISAASEWSKGSTFTVVLPRERP